MNHKFQMEFQSHYRSLKPPYQCAANLKALKSFYVLGILKGSTDMALDYKKQHHINQGGENHSSFLVSTRWHVMAVFLRDVTQCCGENQRQREYVQFKISTWHLGAASVVPAGYTELGLS